VDTEAVEFSAFCKAWILHILGDLVTHRAVDRCQISDFDGENKWLQNICREIGGIRQKDTHNSISFFLYFFFVSSYSSCPWLYLFIVLPSSFPTVTYCHIFTFLTRTCDNYFTVSCNQNWAYLLFIHLLVVTTEIRMSVIRRHLFFHNGRIPLENNILVYYHDFKMNCNLRI